MVDTATNRQVDTVDTAANDKWIQQQTTSGYSSKRQVIQQHTVDTAANDKWIQQTSRQVGYSTANERLVDTVQQQTTSGYSSKRQVDTAANA